MDKKIELSSFDSLFNESLFRMNGFRLDEKLKSLNGQHIIETAIIKCHQEKIKEGLLILKNNLNEYKQSPYYWHAMSICSFLKNDLKNMSYFLDLMLATIPNEKNEIVKKEFQCFYYNNLGLLKIKEKNNFEAIMSFKEAIKISPESLTPKLNLGHLLLSAHLVDESLQIFKESPQNDLDTLYAIGLIHLYKNDFTSALNYFKKIPLKYQNRSDIAGLYSYSLLKTGDLLSAKDVIQKRIGSREFDHRNKQIEDLINQAYKQQGEMK